MKDFADLLINIALMVAVIILLVLSITWLGSALIRFIQMAIAG